MEADAFANLALETKKNDPFTQPRIRGIELSQWAVIELYVCCCV